MNTSMNKIEQMEAQLEQLKRELDRDCWKARY